jgi:hypothetical protein
LRVSVVIVSVPVTMPPTASLAPGAWLNVVVPEPVALAKMPVPLCTVNVPLNVWATFRPVAATSQTVPVSCLVIVPSAVSVRVTVPLAGAQNPPRPFEYVLADAQRIVKVEVYVPVQGPPTVPLEVRVQPAAEDRY